MKVLWTGAESRRWAALLRWKKDYIAAPHKHLSDAHTYILKGKLRVRARIPEAGDYNYEPNGVLHGATLNNNRTKLSAFGTSARRLP